MRIMNIIADELALRYDELTPMEFYRGVFPAGALDAEGAFTPGRYVAIAVQVGEGPNGGQKVKRHTMTDDLALLGTLEGCPDFCIMSPVSYCGKRRISENAREMFALVVELDNLKTMGDEQVGLHRLENQWGERVGWIPKPTYVVASGNGVHLYYQFDEPLRLWPHVVASLRQYKERLTVKVWNSHTTYSYRTEDIQQESVFQAFRMVGTRTKNGDKTRAFLVGGSVSIDYLNSFLLEDEKKCCIKRQYEPSKRMEEARRKYPEWYERRVVRGLPRGNWICKRDLYEWWKRKIYAGARVGHRYHCLMMLSVYAVKCGISQEELEKDAFDLMNFLESKTDDERNHFTAKDVMGAIQAFEDANCIRYSVNAITHRTGIAIEKNKRNGRKQDLHLRLARGNKAILREAGEMKREGRPSAQAKVERWRMMNPEGTKRECKDELGLSYPTIRKWWVNSEE